MSKHRCPLCERKGWEVKRRTWKLWREAVKQGIPVLDYTDSPAVREELRQQIKEELWGDKKPPAPQFKEKDADWALDYAEKKNEKLALSTRKDRDRAYQRDYYHKNKQRIERLRKARLERQAGARRSPTTGAKTNGH